MKVYVQLKDTTHTSKEGIRLTTKGAKQVFETDAKTLDEAWVAVYTGVPLCQRVLIPV